MGRSVQNKIVSLYKTCFRCGETKPSEMFGVDKRATDCRKGDCKACRNILEKKRVKSPAERIRIMKRSARYYRESLKSRAVHLVSSAKIRAKKRGCEFEITTDYIHALLQIGHCWVSGLPFRFTDGTNERITPFSPSLDRRDSDKGYTLGNVQLTCSMYNMGKGHHDEIDFIAMCIAVAERNKDNSAAHSRLAELRDK